MKMEMFPVEREEITYKRKKAKGKRQALLAQFDSEELHFLKPLWRIALAQLLLSLTPSIRSLI